ncbi:MAG: hypothetical protein AAF432_00375 [Planctomycetota bacterium]
MTTTKKMNAHELLDAMRAAGTGRQKIDIAAMHIKPKMSATKLIDVMREGGHWSEATVEKATGILNGGFVPPFEVPGETLALASDSVNELLLEQVTAGNDFACGVAQTLVAMWDHSSLMTDKVVQACEMGGINTADLDASHDRCVDLINDLRAVLPETDDANQTTANGDAQSGDADQHDDKGDATDAKGGDDAGK